LKSASRADRRAARFAAPLLVAAAAVCLEARAPQRASSPLPPAWVACAGGAAGATAHPVRRLTALADKAVVEPDIVRVFAQREKEQRVSAANLAAARLSIDFLYAAGDGAARIYYYEASKTIPDAEGLLRVSVAGWLRGDGASPRSLGAKSELHWIELSGDTDGEPPLIPEPPPIPDAAASLVPLGVLGRANGHVWVMRRAIGKGAVLVYEVGAAGVRLRPTPTAGGCS